MDIDDLPDAVITAGPDRRITEANIQTTRILGLSPDDLLGRDIVDALPLHDTTGRLWWKCTDPWSGLRTRTGHRERLLILPPHREFFVTARYVRAERRGPTQRVVLSFRDVEARRRAETDHAGLISTVAHELRSPLTSVKGFTSTLLRRWDAFNDDQKHLMLTTIEADADRVTRLIGELLDISRIDAGRLEVKRQVIDLPDIVAGHIERMVASGYDRDRFIVTVAPDLPPLWADPDRVHQIVANLLENAVRHGQGIVEVTVTLTRATRPQDNRSTRPETHNADGVCLVVRDHGAGISTDHLRLVFTKFWRGAQRGGTGLGLYVVRGLTVAHGGKVHVANHDDGGAVFTVTLPTAVPDFAR